MIEYKVPSYVKDKKIQKWWKWLNTIQNEIYYARIMQHVCKRFQLIYEQNVRLLHDTTFFFDFVFGSYAAWAVMQIRRQIKVDEDSISLRRLLNELAENITLINRNYFYGIYKQVEFAEEDFDRLVGIGKDFLSPAKLKEDIEKLKLQLEIIESYADKIVAHTDKNPPKKLPTYNDLEAAIQILEEIFEFYNYLIRAQPKNDYDWSKVEIENLFKFAWINKE